MLKQLIIFGLLTSLGFLIAGCTNYQLRGPYGVLRDPDTEFQCAHSVAPLKTPPGVKAIPNDPYYIVPGAKKLETASPVSTLPPGSLAAKQAASKDKKNQSPAPVTCPPL